MPTEFSTCDQIAGGEAVPELLINSLSERSSFSKLLQVDQWTKLDRHKSILQFQICTLWGNKASQKV